MTTALFRRTWDGKLEAADAVSEDLLRSWPEGEVRRGDIRKIRNAQHHRKAFAVLAFAHANQETYPAVDALLEAVKVHVGHVRELRFKDGDAITYVTKSISFGQLGQDEFNDFYSKMLIALEDITGIPQDILERGTTEPV